MYFLSESFFKMNTTQIESNSAEKIHHANIKYKKAGIVILISDKSSKQEMFPQIKSIISYDKS